MPITRLRPTFTLEEDRLAQLRTLLPEAFRDGDFDPTALLDLLGAPADEEAEEIEHFGLTWPGKREARRAAGLPPQGTLTPDPGAGVNEAATRHLFIEGDNLEVLKLLQKSYAGRVKLIYIDPPYNTGNDFIYPDDYSEPLDAYLRRTSQADAEGALTTNTRAGGRFHSNWLSMMYPRLRLARNLLREDGVIFISIDDNEVHNLRQLMGEVFGEENFITTVIWQKVYSPKNTAQHFSEDHDYIVVYAHDAEAWRPSLLPRTAEMDARYSNIDDDPRGSWKPGGLDARNYYSLGTYPIECPSGRVISGPPAGSYWRVSKEKFMELDADNRIWWGEDGNSVPSIKRFLSEVKSGKVPQTLWQYKEVGHTQEAKKELISIVNFKHTENVLNTLKPTRLLQRILQIGTEAETSDIVLDFFSGSASTAQAVLQQNHEDGGNRRFIMVQFPEPLPKPEPNLGTIADIGRERIRRVIAQLQAQDAGKLDLRADEDLGFRAYRLARSSFKPWRDLTTADTQQIEMAFDAFATPLVEGWQPADLLTEILLLEGFPLDSAITYPPTFTHNRVAHVASDARPHHLWLCLDPHIAPETLTQLTLPPDDLLICLDSALTDEAKMRLADAGNVHTI